MKTSDLVIAANTVWVVFAAVLVMFMQAGFAFLEAGLTRMKNAAHIAGKNVLIFGVCSLVYWAVGFGIAFGEGNALIGTSGFFPSTEALLSIGIAVAYIFAGPVLKVLGPQGVYGIGGISAGVAAVILLPLLRLRREEPAQDGLERFVARPNVV